MKPDAEGDDAHLDQRESETVLAYEHVLEEIEGRREVIGSEEDPGQADQVEEDHDTGEVAPAHRGADVDLPSPHQAMNDEDQAVQAAPDHEIPAPAVP